MTTLTETRPTSKHLDIALRFLAAADEAMGPLPKPDTTAKICIWLRTPDGKRVQCEVLSTTYSPHTFFEQAYVRALHGTPFNGQRCAVVPMTGGVSAVHVRADDQT